jgi:outer membrane protein with beta-barrel domain
MAQHIDLRMRFRAAVWLAAVTGFFSGIPSAAAQTTSATPAVSFSVAGGLNVAQMSLPINVFDEVDFDISLDNSSRLGFVGGVLASVPLSRTITFDTGALLSTRGTTMKLTVPGLATAEADLRTVYLDVPVQVRVPIVRARNATLHLLGGTTIAARLHARVHASFASDVADQDMDETFTDEIAPVDVGLTFGGRLDCGRALFIAQYLLGLTDTSRGDAPDPVKHRVFSVMAGWRF